MQHVHLHHATIKTADLAASVEFYQHFLGLREGWRPGFEFPGAWLYPQDSDHALVHLIGDAEPAGPGGMFDHVAFAGQNVGAYLDKLHARGGWYNVAPVPGTNLTQVHHCDPNGVKIEVTFEEPIPGDVARSGAGSGR